MSGLQVFESAEFGSVRTVMVNDEPFFVGKDVTDTLGDPSCDRKRGLKWR